MSGRLIAVVGPSGVGKDTVMEALVQARPALGLVRRVITRPSAAGGEAFDGVTEAEFARMKAAGAFALDWQAHGLCYGIPKRVLVDLDQGRDMLVNLSRKVLPLAQTHFPKFTVLALTARSEVLAQRLARRGRETPQEIQRRLARAEMAMPEGVDCISVDNSGALGTTIRDALAALYPERVIRCS